MINDVELSQNSQCLKVSNSASFTLFGGINVLESRDFAMRVCEEYVRITDKLGIPYVLKLLSIKQIDLR